MAYPLLSPEPEGEGLSYTLESTDYQQDWLPEAGLFLESKQDQVFEAAVQQNAPVSFVSLSVQEAKESPRIHAGTLSGFLDVYQGALRHLARHYSKKNEAPIKRGQNALNLDVFGFAYGSFTVQLRASQNTDLLGEEPHLRVALESLNHLIDLVDEPLKLLLELQSLKGHAAGSIIRLLTFVQEANCPLVHQWATPSSYASYTSRLSVESATMAVDLCRSREDLSRERLDLRGYVDEVKVEKGEWLLINDGDGESYRGVLDPGSDLSLNGVVAGPDSHYVFNCYEVIEQVRGSGREKRTIYATHFQQLGGV